MIFLSNYYPSFKNSVDSNQLVSDKPAEHGFSVIFDNGCKQLYE